MTREEMQRLLDHEARKGANEYEALKTLAEVIGIVFHPVAQDGTDDT